MFGALAPVSVPSEGMTMAGYSGAPLINNIGIKPGHRVAVVDSPNGFSKELGPMPEDAKFVSADGTTKSGTLDVVILFVKGRASLEKLKPKEILGQSVFQI
jgi:hypothetical protein